MAAEFFVTFHNDQWQVVYRGQVFGPYATQGYAIRAVVRAIEAGGAGASRRLTEVTANLAFDAVTRQPSTAH